MSRYSDTGINNRKTERRDVDLIAENQRLRLELRNYYNQAVQNEKKLARFQAQELRLIGARNLANLVETVIHDYRESFDLDVVTLILMDGDHEIQRMLGDAGFGREQLPQLAFIDERSHDLEVLFGFDLKPLLGAFTEGRFARFFPQVPEQPKSIALLPLLRSDTLIGCLALGSHRAERFVNGTATDFLERLAMIVAVCLENAINNERLRLAGLTDALTGLSNRRFFDRRFHDELLRIEREQGSVSCLLLDVDFFKKINDTYGHQVGDQVLRDVAALMRTQLRVSDVLARYGGEEFVAIISDCHVSEVLDVAERIRRCVEGHMFQVSQGDFVRVTVSIGVATHVAGSVPHCEPGELEKMLLAWADKGLYHAKQNGRNRVICYSADKQ